jgi:inner membrane protein
MEDLSLLDRFNNWVKESIIIKLTSIGILILVLMIPSSLVKDLISERQSRADEVIAEVSSKWAASQTVAGPVLMIPYRKIEKIDEWNAGVKYTRAEETIHNAYFVPNDLNIKGTIAPETRHRGIFDVVVYDSKLHLKASFGDINFAKWNIPDEQVMWNDATLILGINDLQGIHENPKIVSGDKSFTSESAGDVGLSINQPASSATGIIVSFDWKSKNDILKDFDIDLALKGSERLYFVPVGKSNSVTLTGKWQAPSFEGKMLPTTSDVTDTTFTANWKVLAFNRPVADQWSDSDQSLTGTEFGVRLLIPADQYQKSMRTAKYSALIILLAFTALFLVEITRKVRIHPFQYILIGIALTIYYTLLLSISEHLGYNTGYAISSIATVLLLTLYSMTFLKTRGLVLLFSSLMTIFYMFIFVIIQAQDFSLLIGSLGLFLIIAVVMYFSRNIRWYKEETKNVSSTTGI